MSFFSSRTYKTITVLLSSERSISYCFIISRRRFVFQKKFLAEIDEVYLQWFVHTLNRIEKTAAMAVEMKNFREIYGRGLRVSWLVLNIHDFDNNKELHFEAWTNSECCAVDSFFGTLN